MKLVFFWHCLSSKWVFGTELPVYINKKHYAIFFGSEIRATEDCPRVSENVRGLAFIHLMSFKGDDVEMSDMVS